MSKARETIQELEKSCTFVMYQADLVRVEEGDGQVPADLPAGTLIDNKYQVLGLLGLGGMGAVYRVKHLALDKVVALKTFISKNFSMEAWQRFEREAKAIARLDHANIIKVLDFGIAENNLPYYTMELVQGESLADRLRRTGSLSLTELLFVFTRLADALEHTHKKAILHRDLKPGNVYLELKGGQIQNIKLADFGIAALANQNREEQALTAQGTIFGSPLYMSPEQTLGEKLDQRSDIYSLGCVLYECAMGFPPYHGDSALATIIMHQTAAIPPIERDDLPEWLPALYLSMMQKDRQKRLPDLSEILDILAFNLAASTTGKKADSNGQRPILKKRKDTDRSKPAERPRTAPLLVPLSGLLLLVASAALFFILAPHKPEHPVQREVAATAAVSESKKEPLISWRPLTEKPGKILINFPRTTIGRITYSNGFKREAAGPVEVDAREPVTLHLTNLYPHSAEELALLPNSCFDDLHQSKNLASDWDDSYFEVLSHFLKLKRLEVYDSICTPRTIGYLNNLPHLQALRLTSSNLAESDLLQLKNLKEFWQLSLSRFKISPRLIGALGQERISVMDLRECRLEPGVIESLCRLKNLNSLELQDTRLSLADLELMQSRMTNLRQLKLLRTGLSEQAIPILLRFKNLEAVEVPDDWSNASVIKLQAKLKVLNKQPGRTDFE